MVQRIKEYFDYKKNKRMLRRELINMAAAVLSAAKELAEQAEEEEKE